jgi:hypothetical protein
MAVAVGDGTYAKALMSRSALQHLGTLDDDPSALELEVALGLEGLEDLIDAGAGSAHEPGQRGLCHIEIQQRPALGVTADVAGQGRGIVAELLQELREADEIREQKGYDSYSQSLSSSLRSVVRRRANCGVKGQLSLRRTSCYNLVGGLPCARGRPAVNSWDGSNTRHSTKRR